MTDPLADHPSRDRRVCIVCGRVLDYWDGRGWQHSTASRDPDEIDHPPIPVSPEEAGEQLRARCDFCYADYPEFVVPAKSFGTGIGESVGGWAACEACAGHIEADAWNRLMERVVASWEARHGPMEESIRTGLNRLYRTLRKNITGSVRRAEPGPNP